MGDEQLYPGDNYEQAKTTVVRSETLHSGRLKNLLGNAGNGLPGQDGSEVEVRTVMEVTYSRSNPQPKVAAAPTDMTLLEGKGFTPDQAGRLVDLHVQWTPEKINLEGNEPQGPRGEGSVEAFRRWQQEHNKS